jgi:adenosylcobinamide kinase/adenosylcobinamide-phosphate guanylyltransferase
MGKGHFTFILGGSRSGKSGFALQLASGLEGRKAFIATAQALDEEMNDRIARHKLERSPEWITFEEPLELPRLIAGMSNEFDIILVDCLTLWLSNLMLNNHDIETDIETMLSSAVACPSSLLIVSNEVGMGIVPENALARKFRDFAGMLNRRAAEIANDVWLVTAGIPMRIKGK